MKYESREIRSAMIGNSISIEELLSYVNNSITKPIKHNTLNRIIAGSRKNKEVEAVLSSLLGDWIDAARAIHTDARVAMPDRFACSDLAMQNQQNNY